MKYVGAVIDICLSEMALIKDTNKRQRLAEHVKGENDYAFE